MPQGTEHKLISVTFSIGKKEFIMTHLDSNFLVQKCD